MLVNLTNNDTSEGSLSTSSLTFTPSNWSTAVAVTVTGVDDFVDDNNVTYNVGIEAFSADLGYLGVTAGRSVVNVDNDTAGLSVSTISGKPLMSLVKQRRSQ